MLRRYFFVQLQRDVLVFIGDSGNKIPCTLEKVLFLCYNF